MPATPQEIFERYVWTGITRNADARADMFTVDGVLESPMIPSGGAYPRRIEGREEIRSALRALHERMAGDDQTVNADQSRYVLHTTADPDVFIAEMDVALEVAGELEMLSLLYIFRMRDGEIAMLRDYFPPEHAH